MIKGIIALFTSGALFNPMVLLGIICGFTAMLCLDSEPLRALYTNPNLYMLMMLIAALYVICFRRVYYRGGVDTDWGQTIAGIIGHFFRLALSFIFSMLFIYSISFGGDDLDQTPDFSEYDRMEKDLTNQAKEISSNAKAIMNEYQTAQ
jgi:hypothetical protein